MTTQARQLCGIGPQPSRKIRRAPPCDEGPPYVEIVPNAKPVKTGLLTPREQQILQWIYHGKSNIEIGMILEISPLTVKNHVQKTLRKLNVLNRTQAVGKALALRIVNP